MLQIRIRINKDQRAGIFAEKRRILGCPIFRRFRARKTVSAAADPFAHIKPEFLESCTSLYCQSNGVSNKTVFSSVASLKKSVGEAFLELRLDLCELAGSLREPGVGTAELFLKRQNRGQRAAFERHLQALYFPQSVCDLSFFACLHAASEHHTKKSTQTHKNRTVPAKVDFRKTPIVNFSQTPPVKSIDYVLSIAEAARVGNHPPWETRSSAAWPMCNYVKAVKTRFKYILR